MGCRCAAFVVPTSKWSKKWICKSCGHSNKLHGDAALVTINSSNTVDVKEKGVVASVSSTASISKNPSSRNNGLSSQRSQSSPSSSCPDKHKTCIIIQRLLDCLEGYNKSKDGNDTDESFNKFMDEDYKHKIYDDYYHLTKSHQHELESIKQFAIESKKFSKCDLSTCNFANRHFRVDTAENSHYQTNKETMKYINIYVETLDSLHYYLFHLTETGMRESSQSDENNQQDDDERKKEENVSSEHFDSSFKRICNVIKNCREKTSRFTRINGNKFNISVVQSEVKGDDTFLDAVYEDISQNENDDIPFLVQKIIEMNGYDTDSLDLDLEMFINDETSNLSKLLSQHKGIHNKMVKLLQKYKSYVLHKDLCVSKANLRQFKY